MLDIAIIGAGIIGSFIAHDLSKYNLKVALFEKNSDVANEATMANSAIIHSGHDPKEGTLKAKLNIKGNQMYEGICRELGTSFRRTSAFVVATSMEEEVVLDSLYKQAKDRAIPVYYVTREAALEKEKNLSDAITKVIELPSTGIIYPWEVAIALVEEAFLNGVAIYLQEEVIAIQKKEYFTVTTSKGVYQAKQIINAAGVYADKIYNMVSTKQQFEITPRKGEYFVLDKLKESFVNRVIYPVPSASGKGVLVVPTTHENTLLGPNSVFIEDKEGNNNTKDALDFVKKEVLKTVKNVPLDKVIRIFAGLRPTGNMGDFIIEEAEDVAGFINVACIESPGLASAPAISEYVIQNLLQVDHKFSQKIDYIKRIPITDFKQLTAEKRQEKIAENPAFARVVCRCEQITEGEIVEAINRPIGAKTVKAIKKRVRPGMGRCQGGFCEPLVIEIIARELSISPLCVRMDSEASTMLLAETKGGKEK